MAKGKSGAVSTDGPLQPEHLAQIANCLAYIVVHSGDLKDKPNSDRIPILAGLGFDRNAVASILQTTPETVSVRLSQLKAETKGQKASKAVSADTSAPLSIA
jgi:hypothetical protein